MVAVVNPKNGTAIVENVGAKLVVEKTQQPRSGDSKELQQFHQPNVAGMHAQETIHWVLHKIDSAHKYGNQDEDARPQGQSTIWIWLIPSFIDCKHWTVLFYGTPLLEVILLLRRTAGKSSFPVGHSISLNDDPRLTGTIDEHTIARNAAGFSLQRSRWMHNLGGRWPNKIINISWKRGTLNHSFE